MGIMDKVASLVGVVADAVAQNRNDPVGAGRQIITQTPLYNSAVQRTNQITNAVTFGQAPIRATRNRTVCAYFNVKGVNPASGRKKTVSVVAAANASIAEIQAKSGLLPPYEVSVDKNNFTPPTEAQVRYAARLGFKFPADATVRDATVFLTRSENGVPLVQPPAPDRLVHYIISKGGYVPAYSGAAEISAEYLHCCEPKEKAAFFCMRVYCTLTHAEYLLLEDVPSNLAAVFWEFGGLYCSDEGFSRSLEYYSHLDLPLDKCSALKRIKAFNIAAGYLVMKGVCR